MIYKLLRISGSLFILKSSFSYRVTMATKATTTLESLNFDNLVLRSLPIDSEENNYVRTVRGACFSRTKPTPVKNPRVVAYSADALQLLDLDEDQAQRPQFADYFSGNSILPGSEPAAHCYCGHQFGYFSGQLGDGAAMYLGEVVNHRDERWEIQLKGAGLTPYSRQADGRKVLRSSIREFLCSEAMHFLGIPTTRAGSCVTSDSKVLRDVFYNGNNIAEQCTIVLRIAPTFIRFGSFEIFKTTDQFTGRHGPSVGRKEILTQLIDYSINTFFPEIAAAHREDELTMRKSFFTDVVKRTAQMVALWQCVGFCHGVLNTDNMSILGLTIDYGPFGFMDRYDPDHVCNGSDDGGRYTYVNQPDICEWNLTKLAEALNPALPLDESLPIIKEEYYKEFNTAYLEKMRLKLGLFRNQIDSDSELVKELLSTMELVGSDFTNTWRALNQLHPLQDDKDEALVEFLLSQGSSLEELIKASNGAIDQRNYQMFLLLMRTNPEVLAQLGKGVESVKRVMARIEKVQKLKEMEPATKKDRDRESWHNWLKKYRERLLLEGDWSEDNVQKRIEVMNSNNPSFVLRNYIAQEAIELAESGDYTAVRNALELLKTPYDEHQLGTSGVTRKSKKKHSQKEACVRIPDWAHSLRVT